jgi:hypothetical protein
VDVTNVLEVDVLADFVDVVTGDVETGATDTVLDVTLALLVLVVDDGLCVELVTWWVEVVCL